VLLFGESLLGLDVYSRYNSTWNWDNPTSALQMTKRPNEINEEFSSDEM